MPFFTGTKNDVEALELGGNKLVNACYEGKLTKEAMKEKEKRETKKYGYEAFFFEKHVNLTYFDEILYKNMINQSSKALVEKRFNMSLRSFNLKKTAAVEAEVENDDVLCFSDEEEEDGEDDDDDNHNSGEVSFSSQEEEASPHPRAHRREFVSKAHSETRLVSRRQVAGRRVRSARSILEEDGEAKATTNNTEGRQRRRVSSRRINLGNGEEEARPRRQSNRRIPAGSEEEARARRQSHRRLSGRNIAVDSEPGGSDTRRKSTGRSPVRPTGSGSERRESGGVPRKGSSRRVEGGEGPRSTARSSRHGEHN
jgi:hypothetical protein